MSAQLIALARIQAAGLRSAVSACDPSSQAALRARLVTAADSLDGLATVAEHVIEKVSDVSTELNRCAAELSTLSARAKQ